MSVSLKTLRQTLGLSVGECIVSTLTGTPTATVLYDETLADSGESAQLYQGAYLLMTSGAQSGQVRRVSEYAQANGALTMGRAFSSAPAAGDTYEMHKLMAPADLNRCINEGLGRCWYLTREELTIVEGQREYALSGYTWLTQPAQVVNVLWKSGDTASAYRYNPLDWYHVSEDAGELTLHIRPYTAESTDALVLQAIRPYEELASDSATTDCPQAWALAAARMMVYRWLMYNAPAQDVGRYKEQYALASAEFAGLNRRYAPRPPRRAQHSDSPQRGVDSDIVTW